MVFLKLFIFLVIEDNAMDSVGELCLMFIYESVKKSCIMIIIICLKFINFQLVSLYW